MRRSDFTLLLVSSVVLFATVAASGASFTPLGDLPGGAFQSVARGISGDGRTVVGQSRVADYSVFPELAAYEWQAFVWDAEQGMRSAPPSFYAQDATAVSADGSAIVGNRGQPEGASVPNRSFVWDAAHGMQDLGTLWPNTYVSTANAVSADGSVVVGRTIDATGTTTAFIWTAQDGMRALGSLGGRPVREALGISADGRRVVGYDARGAAFVWDEPGGLRNLFPGDNFASRGNAISADGTTIVGFHRSEGRIRGFRWVDGIGARDLDGGVGNINTTDVSAVSGDGSTVVGSMQDEALNPVEAFVWTEGGGLQSLRVLLTVLGVDLTGWRLMRATGISYDGTTIAGTGWNPAGQMEAWIAVIPEPSPALLMLLGFAGLGCRRNLSR